MNLIKPPKLKRGDTVAAISLSSGAAHSFPHRYEAGKRQLAETFDLNIIETPHALRSDDWLYHNPQARANDLHWALTNPDIGAIISIIGGYESVRILPFLGPHLIRQHPKIFMGFSDATVTLSAFLNAGVLSFHGPALMTDLAENTGIHPFVEASLSSNALRRRGKHAQHFTRLDGRIFRLGRAGTAKPTTYLFAQRRLVLVARGIQG